MDCRITLSLNAGIAIQIGKIKVLVDAFFEQADDGISVMSTELFEQVLVSSDFTDPDYLFFTHAHKDHYSEKLTRIFLNRYPKCTLIGPETIFTDELEVFNRIILRDEFSFIHDGLEFNFFPILHEGGPSKETPHFGCVLSFSGDNIFLAGDGQIPSEILAEKAKNKSVDLAILDFPWLTAPKGKKFLLENLQPKHVVLYHLPMSADDKYRYLSAVNLAISKITDDMDIRVLNEPLTTEKFDL
jgi:L-ascorbate metabolism protein UlaG (beta-lactamase superfamily)